jgi:hypothetical protein
MAGVRHSGLTNVTSVAETVTDDFTVTDRLTINGDTVNSATNPAAAGNAQGNATALTKDYNGVTGADGTKGVKLPTGVAGKRVVVVNTDTTNRLKVYPATGAAINAVAANGAITMNPGERLVFEAESATQWRTGKRTARGQQTSASATDTVVTGLSVVESVVASYDTDPGDANTFVSATIGDQAGAPAAGSIILKQWKSGDGADVTPVAGSSFSKKINWIAFGE